MSDAEMRAIMLELGITPERYLEMCEEGRQREQQAQAAAATQAAAAREENARNEW